MARAQLTVFYVFTENDVEKSETITLDVKTSDTIGYIKNMLCSLKGVEASMLKLSIRGKAVVDEKSLGFVKLIECKVVEGLVEWKASDTNPGYNVLKVSKGQQLREAIAEKGLIFKNEKGQPVKTDRITIEKLARFLADNWDTAQSSSCNGIQILVKNRCGQVIPLTVKAGDTIDVSDYLDYTFTVSLFVDGVLIDKDQAVDYDPDDHDNVGHVIFGGGPSGSESLTFCLDEHFAPLNEHLGPDGDSLDWKETHAVTVTQPLCNGTTGQVALSDFFSSGVTYSIHFAKKPESLA